MIETNLNGESLNILYENIEKIKEVFPEIVTEDKIDFDKFKLIFSDYINNDNERFNFTWYGKSNAIKEAQKTSNGTLIPCKEESKSWDTTKNIYIEGDNLEVLKLLQKSYYNKIKMIFIDPPYNTGKDFIYPDNYSDTIYNYLMITNQITSGGGGNQKINSNTEFNGRFHTNWLNMMYPRLRLARNLLSEDGVIFISIDDNEQVNLKKVCDEIFGEMNFVRNVIWEKKYSPANDSKVISDNHDHILVYCKNLNSWTMGLLPRTKEMNKRYKNIDNDIRGPWKPGGLSAKTYNEKYDYPIKTPSGKIVYPPTGSCWQVSQKRLEELIQDKRIYFGKNNDSKPQIKQFLSEVKQGLVSRSIWKYNEVGHNQVSRKEITNIFGKFIFDTPKPLKLIYRMIQIANVKDGDIILDFFSGSSSTAHSTLCYNNINDKKCNFIMIQIPELCDKKSEAFKSGYKNICEIGEERIRRAGDKIVDESRNNDLDIGFKVFKLDSSNLTKWNPDMDNLEDSLVSNEDNIIPHRNELDLVYEIMLKYGIDLTSPVEEIEISDKKVYSVGYGSLLICLDDNVTSNFASNIIKVKNDLGSEITRVVFKDNGFNSDSDKTNIKETLRANNIEEFITI